MPTTNLPFSGALPLVLFVAKATLLLVMALLATSTLRRGTAGARHLVWLAALVGVLALPLLSRIESLHVGLLPSRLAEPSALSFDAARADLVQRVTGSAVPRAAKATAPSSKAAGSDEIT